MSGQADRHTHKQTQIDRQVADVTYIHIPVYILTATYRQRHMLRGSTDPIMRVDTSRVGRLPQDQHSRLIPVPHDEATRSVRTWNDQQTSP